MHPPGRPWEDLPPRLRERVEIEADRLAVLDGAYVLYWLHHALRGHENPALDVALECAARLDRPVLVYQGFSGRHRFNNDRHLAFLLEGARDLQAELAGRGIPFAFHMPRDPDEPSPLELLALRSAMVVTEDLPLQPFPRWSTALAEATAVPLLRVDTACTVPMRVVGRAYHEIDGFREATGDERTGRLALAWPEVDVAAGMRLPDDLPFLPVDLGAADLPALVASVPIDHIVGPVPGTPGGSRAGYARWAAFRVEDDWTRRSCLSPYLHYGMVSPLRIAREAGGEFLERLCVRREAAYCFCRYSPAYDDLDVLPDWARATLTEHAPDPRPPLPSWEALARGETGDEPWDRAQKSLLVRGELDDERRTYWGKTLLEWAPSPERALRLMEDLNHRYALDGSDPASYGGILGCLGLFEEPAATERPVLGTVPPPLAVERVGRPVADRLPRTVAVVGAGMAGLTAARTLADHGLSVTVFEKARGVGGRMSRRRDEPWAFDHGTQFLTVRDRRFRRYVESWVSDGVLAEWSTRIADVSAGHCRIVADGVKRYLGTPGMNAVCKHLARELPVRLRTQVGHLERTGAGWRPCDEQGEGLGTFDVVVVSAPAPQAVPLLTAAPQLAERATGSRMVPCLAAMLAFDRSLELGFDAAFVRDSALDWIGCDSVKPGRAGSGEGEAWVLHAHADWSARHMPESTELVLDRLVNALRGAVGRDLPEPVRAHLHRWRYSLVAEPAGAACLWDEGARLGACGDWCLGSRVESAFLSGAALAGRILGMPEGDG